MGTLALSAVLLALAPMGLGAAGVALWVLYPVLPMGAGFVLGRRQLLWQMAAITMAIAAAGGYLALMAGEGVILDRIASLVLLGALAACIWMTSWFAARALRSDSDRRDILGESLAVVKGVLVVPFNWVVGGVQSEALRLELHELKRRHNPRWIVLDLAPAGELGRRDLSAIERAAEAVSTGHCTIVLTRPPVDALGHLDFAQPAVGRIERYATVPQAVEAGLRRLGWSQGTDQPQRVVTTL